MKQLILSALAILGIAAIGYSQCAQSTSQWGSGNAPAVGSNINITTCAFGGEYSIINNVVAGLQYTVTYTGGSGNYVTVYDGGGTPLYWGANQVVFVAPSSGTYYSQINTNPSCGTESSCHTCNWAAANAPTPCAAAPNNLNASNLTSTSADLTWSADPGVVSYMVEWGAPGFAPGMGAQIGSASPSTELANATGLTANTDYEFYVMTDCGGGLSTSWGGPFAFTTLANCADVTSIAASTVTDSIFMAWSFNPNPGYPATGFAVEYGNLGFMQGTGTYNMLDANFTDTLDNPAFVGGAIYDVYIQSICGVDSGWWIGPVTVTMPLTNDMPCNAEELMTNSTVYYLNGNGATVDAGEAAIAPPGTGCTGQGQWCNTNITNSVWFTFIAPPSGGVIIDGSEQAFDGQLAVYEVTACNDYNTYTLVGANDDDGAAFSPMVEVCGLTPGNMYYVLHDPYGTPGVYSLRIDALELEAGSDNGMLSICAGDIVDLSTQLTGADAGGTWTGITTSAGLTDSLFNSNGLGFQVFEFQYTVTMGCAMDSAITSVEIYPPSSAGNDGTISACKNEPINLLSGLSGTANLNGTWYDESNNMTSPSMTANATSGTYTFNYITGNGVCPDDTATVTVTVLACDYLNVEELLFGNVEMYPNPTNDVLFISNSGSNEVYSLEITDLNGKVMVALENAISGTETMTVDFEEMETGLYLVRLFNENGDKTFRVVKQ